MEASKLNSSSPAPAYSCQKIFISLSILFKQCTLRIIANALFSAVCCVVLIPSHYFHSCCCLMGTNNLITNNSLNNPDLCAQMGQKVCSSLCLLHLSVAAEGSINPGVGELTPVYACFVTERLMCHI